MQLNRKRWEERFEVFDNAYKRLEEAINLPKLNELERNGLIQRFEFTIDIAWKVMKDYLTDNGFQFKPSPKDTYRQAQNAELIDFAQDLIDGLEIRNNLSHDYSGELFIESESTLRNNVFPALKKLRLFYNNELKSTNGN